MSWTNNVNAGKVASIKGQLPGYENCVLGLNSNNSREEFITDAYAVLGTYYLNNNNIAQARAYRSKVAQENKRR